MNRPRVVWKAEKETLQIGHGDNYLFCRVVKPRDGDLKLTINISHAKHGSKSNEWETIGTIWLDGEELGIAIEHLKNLLKKFETQKTL